ncbi:MAG TPA: ABC transporter permease [Steroidobacteraceae bacterium]
MLIALIRSELLKLQRAPAFLIPTLLFPILFFAMFGLTQTQGMLHGIPAPTYLLASFASFSVMSTSLFSFGVTIAAERSAGWHRLVQISPIAPVWYLLSKLAVACLFTLLSITLLVGFAMLTTGTVPPALLWKLPLALLIGVLPFAAIGIVLGLSCSPGAASAIANLIFLPMAFASGLFIPLEYLPKLMREIAVVLPSYHLGLIAWNVVGAPTRSPPVVSVALLILFSAIVLMFGTAVYRRGMDEIR